MDFEILFTFILLDLLFKDYYENNLLNILICDREQKSWQNEIQGYLLFLHSQNLISHRQFCLYGEPVMITIICTVLENTDTASLNRVYKHGFCFLRIVCSALVNKS